MKRPSLVALLGLVLGVGVAAAAPTATAPAGGHSPVAVDCNACLGGAPCSPGRKTACAKEIEDRLVEHWNATPGVPKVAMMRVSGTQLPRDIKQGKYFAYGTINNNKPTSTAGLTSVLWPSGKLAVLPVSRVAHIDPADAATAHRQPKWDANGQSIADCDEYGYEQIYDVGRFLDAANACRGDTDCIFDVAFMPQTPGIAERELERKDGERMSGRLPLATGVFPKNDMFTLGKRLLYADGMPGSSDAHGFEPIEKDPALEAALETGLTYYSIGASANDNTRKFANEWRWHKKLRTMTQSVTPAEREEYERRKAKFRLLVAQWHAAVNAEQAKEAKIMQPKEHRLVLPYDMQTHDPFERYDRVQDIRERVTRIENEALKRFGQGHRMKPAIGGINVQPAISTPGTLNPDAVNPGAVNPGAVNPGAQQQQGALRRPTPAIGVLGAPGPAAGTSSAGPATTGALPPAHKAQKSKLQLGRCMRTEGWGFEMHHMGPVSCRIGAFLRDEWARKKAGFKSCLDLENRDCDWAPEMLTGSILDHVPALDQHLQHSKRCRAWTDGTFSPPAANLKAVEKQIRDLEKLVGTARQELKPYEKSENSHGLVFKQSSSMIEDYGQKKWFGAHASYDVGWDVAAAATAAAKDGVAKVCELKGGLHGDIDMHASIANKKFALIDGNVQVQINQSNASHEARFKSHLVLKGEQVYQTGNGSSPSWIASQVLESREPIWGERSDSASFTYWIAGAVPVTGAMWGELVVAFEIAASGTSPTSCDTASTAFETKGEFGPTMYAFGVGQVGLGVADLVSAGLRSTVNLVQLELPLKVGMKVAMLSSQPTLKFDSSITLRLRTLSGRLSLYLQFLLYDEEWELFRWSGIGPAEVQLMPRLTAKMPMLGMSKAQ